ncbi:MAG: hypothetical protein LH478_08950 [Chitinophagaceae bacterium]|nr:hypothetical protein [Chitinophagaceae bacterium]
MNKLPNSTKTLLSLLLLLSISFLNNTASSQEKPLISRVAVTVDQWHTNIWISDFPVRTKVILVDAEDNILGVVTTNQFGAAYTQFSKLVYLQVTARTFNGELRVSNTAIVNAVASTDANAASEKKAVDKV